MEEEKLGLFLERIREIPGENTVKEPFRPFFVKEAEYILMVLGEAEKLKNTENESLSSLEERNALIFGDVLPEVYAESFGNPVFACAALGKEYGQLLGFLFTEVHELYVYAVEGRLFDICAVLELFIQVYVCFEDEEPPKADSLREIIYYYNFDYCREFFEKRIAARVDPKEDFAIRIIMDSDLSDIRYLYRFGEYITENERKMAEFLNSLPDEEIESMAATYTQGYKKGFEVCGKDMSIKKTVELHFQLGFERMMRAAIRQFGEMGLTCTAVRRASHVIDKRGTRTGYSGAVPNRQYEYDHRNDIALFLDENFVTRALGAWREGFEEQKTNARLQGGPAYIDVFGGKPFEPENVSDAVSLSERGQELLSRLNSEIVQITNRYIAANEKSFTIIAYPIPEIGDNFEEIFKETVRINTLDYMTYRDIQQKLIDAMDKGKHALIKGSGKNRTDLKVMLYPVSDPEKETIFENCVADVNIPVGEVFTTPVLKGTEGVLHVTEVFLDGLKFKDLSLTIKDGFITEYSCGNFESEEENRTLIGENILFHHKSLPIGEFAIGTNTTAYEAGKRLGLSGVFPILIAEKTGPHFAFGDTCFKWDEDNITYNPDGKAIVARENEVSAMRKTDIGKAYFGCHTDITIPYDELKFIKVVCADGSETSIIENGMFVLPGCEELNKPLQK